MATEAAALAAAAADLAARAKGGGNHPSVAVAATASASGQRISSDGLFSSASHLPNGAPLAALSRKQEEVATQLTQIAARKARMSSDADAAR